MLDRPYIHRDQWNWDPYISEKAECRTDYWHPTFLRYGAKN